MAVTISRPAPPREAKQPPETYSGAFVWRVCWWSASIGALMMSDSPGQAVALLVTFAACFGLIELVRWLAKHIRWV